MKKCLLKPTTFFIHSASSCIWTELLLLLLKNTRLVHNLGRAARGFLDVNYFSSLSSSADHFLQSLQFPWWNFFFPWKFENSRHLPVWFFSPPNPLKCNVAQISIYYRAASLLAPALSFITVMCHLLSTISSFLANFGSRESASASQIFTSGIHWLLRRWTNYCSQKSRSCN